MKVALFEFEPKRLSRFLLKTGDHCSDDASNGSMIDIEWSLLFRFDRSDAGLQKKRQLLSYTAIFENMQRKCVTSPNIAFETTAFNEWPPVLNGQLWSKTQV